MDAKTELDWLRKKIDSGDISPDEPLFILRGRDSLAAGIVREWASIAGDTICPAEKVAEAFALADRMDQWPIKQIPGVPETRVDKTPIE